MKCIIRWIWILALLSGCASKQTSTQSSADAQKDLEERYRPRIGSAHKEDFIQEFGPANWCRTSQGGEESCRFYKKLQTVWTGNVTDRVHRETYDEVIAEFGVDGTLKSFQAHTQR